VRDTTGAALITAQFNPALLPDQNGVDQAASAIVRHQDPAHSQTLSLCDGWGRIIETKKTADIDVGSGNSGPGLVISGHASYDEYGRLITQGEPAFLSAATVDSAPLFDGGGSGNITTFEYDVLARPTRVIFPPFQNLPTRPPITTSYQVVSLNGVLRALEQVTEHKDAATVVTRETYRDARGRITSVDEHNEVGTATTLTTLTTKYDYDAFDQLLHVYDAKPSGPDVTQADWDSLGRLAKLTSPDAGITFYDYNVSGTLGRKVNGNGKRILYTYTENQLQRIDYPDGTNAPVVFTWGNPGAQNGGRGRVTNRTDETGATAFQYDNLGNVSRTDWTPAVAGTPPTYTSRFTYEPVFNTLQELRVDNDTIDYTYNSAGHVSSVRSTAQPQRFYVQKILYDVFDRRTRLALGDGTTTTYTYEPVSRRLTNVDTVGLTGNAIQHLVYSYDFAGNVKTLQNNVTAPGASPPAGTVVPGATSYTFAYDDLYQLKNATGSYTSFAAPGGRAFTLGMTYDEIGNIKNKNQIDQTTNASGAVTGTVTATSYNTTYTYGGPRPHAVTKLAAFGNTRTSDYDGDGNQMYVHGPLGSGRDMTWNEEDRLKSITTNGTTTTFLYRPDGDRAVKSGTSDFHYVNQYWVARPGISTSHHVMVGDERVATIQTSQTSGFSYFFYHGDLLQSSNYVTNFQGTLTQHDEYFPSGETWVEEVANNDPNNRTPYLFSAKELDDTGLYYFGARYYDPRLSHWVSPDPILSTYLLGQINAGVFAPQNLALYAYAANNPVRYRDSTGGWVSDMGFPSPAGLSRPLGPPANTPDGRQALAILKLMIWLPIVGYLSVVPGGRYVLAGLSAVSAVEHASNYVQTGDERENALAFLAIAGTQLPESAVPERNLLQEAREARDALAAELAPLGKKAPLTVTAGYNVKTGQVAARACGGGMCAEDHVVEALGGKREDVRFTEATRPKNGKEVSICERCEGKYGREPFPPGTRFRSDQPKPPK
jgi:RHS repeat-associated protein